MGKEGARTTFQERGSPVLIGDELSRAVSGPKGRLAKLRVVHPMDTYREGRRAGVKVGMSVGMLSMFLREGSLYDNYHWASILGFTVAVLIAFWVAWHRKPNKVAVDVRKSVDIYRDEDL